MELTTAQQLAWDLAAPKGEEWVEVSRSLGRVLARSLPARWNLPREPRALMDGFAVRSRDCLDVSTQHPVVLRLAATVCAAGHSSEQPLGPGEAMRIMTGAVLPGNADAVIAKEDIEERDGTLFVAHTVAPGDWVATPGKEVRHGEVVLPEGSLLTPTRLALAAALGHASLPVRERPTVALLATGDEIIELGEIPQGPYSYCNNRHLLALLVEAQGGYPIHLGVAGDNHQAISGRLDGTKTDLVITTGGIGRGDRDFVLQSWQALGITTHFREINLSPGKNSALGSRGEQVFCALPGNPWAAQVVFGEIIAPMLRRWQGIMLAEEPCSITAVLSAQLQKRQGFYQAVRGMLDLHQGKAVFTPAEHRSSSLFARLTASNCHAMLGPHESRVSVGTLLKVRCPDLPLLALGTITK